VELPGNCEREGGQQRHKQQHHASVSRQGSGNAARQITRAIMSLVPSAAQPGGRGREPTRSADFSASALPGRASRAARRALRRRAASAGHRREPPRRLAHRPRARRQPGRALRQTNVSAGMPQSGRSLRRSRPGAKRDRAPSSAALRTRGAAQPLATAPSRRPGPGGSAGSASPVLRRRGATWRLKQAAPSKARVPSALHAAPGAASWRTTSPPAPGPRAAERPPDPPRVVRPK
jgi:hypothetical protein